MSRNSDNDLLVEYEKSCVTQTSNLSLLEGKKNAMKTNKKINLKLTVCKVKTYIIR